MEFFFSKTGYLTKAKEPTRPLYLSIIGGRIIGFRPFPKDLMLFNPSRPGFELELPCLFPRTVTIISREPTTYEYVTVNLHNSFSIYLYNIIFLYRVVMINIFIQNLGPKQQQQCHQQNIHQMMTRASSKVWRRKPHYNYPRSLSSNCGYW